MDHNPFGSTGSTISRVGLGAWAIGGQGWKYAWGAQDDASSIAAIRHAVASGVTWVDTAACYGRGHSEEIVARALSGIPQGERPRVFTKCGVIAPEGDADPALVGAPASIRREVEDSLRRLRTDVIDLYFMHWPAQDGTPLADYWGTLADLRAAGKVRWIGLSNHDPEQLAAAHQRRVVENCVLEVVKPPLERHHRLPDVDQLSGVLADDVHPENLPRLAVKQHFEHPVHVAQQLAPGDLAVAGDPRLVRHSLTRELILVSPHVGYLGNRVDAEGERHIHALLLNPEGVAGRKPPLARGRGRKRGKADHVASRIHVGHLCLKIVVDGELAPLVRHKAKLVEAEIVCGAHAPG